MSKVYVIERVEFACFDGVYEHTSFVDRVFKSQKKAEKYLFENEGCKTLFDNGDYVGYGFKMTITNLV